MLQIICQYFCGLLNTAGYNVMLVEDLRFKMYLGIAHRRKIKIYKDIVKSCEMYNCYFKQAVKLFSN